MAKLKPVIWGLGGAIILLTIYFVLITLLSGRDYAQEQFLQYWYYIVSLALGFGIQLGLYMYLREKMKNGCSRGTVAVSGTSTAVAMISCCSHYLATIIPFLGLAGFFSAIGRYQIPIFWVGLVSNAIGIIFSLRKIIIHKH